MFKKKILIDLDGVLNEYGEEAFNENYIPKIKIGAKKFIEELSKIGELYLFYFPKFNYVSKMVD